MGTGYVFKPTAEFVWAVVTAVVIVLAEIALNFDPTVITDWGTWALATVGAVVRAIGAAVLVIAGRRAVD